MHTATVLPFSAPEPWPSRANLTATIGAAMLLDSRFGVEVEASDRGPVVYVGRQSGGDWSFDVWDAYCLSREPGTGVIELGDLANPCEPPSRHSNLGAALNAMKAHYATR